MIHNTHTRRFAWAVGLAVALTAATSQASLTIDLRFQDGSTTKDISGAANGTAYTIDVWATVVNTAGTNDVSSYLQWLSYDAVTAQQNAAVAGNITAAAIGDPSINSGKSTALWNGSALGSPDGNATAGTPQVIGTYGAADTFTDLGGVTNAPATVPKYPRADAGVNSAATQITAAIATGATAGLVPGVDFNVNATGSAVNGTIGSTTVSLPAHSLQFLVGSFTFTLSSAVGTVAGNTATNAFQLIPGVYTLGSTTALATSGSATTNPVGLLTGVNRGNFAEGTTSKTTTGVYLSGTPIQFTVTGTGGGGLAAAPYTLSAASSAATIMKGDTATITSTITNTGVSGTNDTFSYTGLTASVTGGTGTGTLSGSATSGGPVAVGNGTGVNNGLTLTGTGYGTVILTSAVTQPTNTTNTTTGTPTLSGSAGTVTVNVGTMTPTNAGAGSTAQLTTYSTALTSHSLTSGKSYTGFGTQTDGTASGSVATKADLLDGVAGSYTGGANNNGGARTISMAWRTRATNEISPNINAYPGTGAQVAFGAGTPFAKASFGAFSDVVQLSGLDGSTGTPAATAHTQTDLFVLQMTITDAAVGTHANGITMMNNGHLYLGWLDDQTGTPTWKNAVEGNFGGLAYQGHGLLNVTYANYLAGTSSVNHIVKTSTGAGSEVLGDWGVVDLGSGQGFAVWAVLNHNSAFAALPEPSSFVMAGMGLVGLVTVIRRRRKVSAETVAA